MNQEIVKIIHNEPVASDYFRMGLKCSPGFLDAVPGQFVMLRIDRGSKFLLRRPFSIHRITKSEDGLEIVEILYRVVGQGTGVLAHMQPGEEVDLLGPLGRGFRYHHKWKRMVMIAGGIGVAPMLFLAQSMIQNGFDLSASEIFLGGRTQNDILCSRDFSDMSMTVHLTTDDGSQGDQCLVTDPFELAAQREKPDVVYACGPMPMLSCVVGIARKMEIPCQVSIETLMACGMGACLGCALESGREPDRYLHGCMDGPVFDAEEIVI
jgi:dihydroorotate dehydrogenase electron transfer subunit